MIWPADAGHMLVRGQALVIVGPPSCGKTMLAIAIAKAHGTYAEVPARDLESPFTFGSWLAKQLDTLVIEGAPPQGHALQALKAAISSEQAEVNTRGAPVTLVRSPNFIFCTGHLDWIGPDDRRFLVHRMQARGATQ